MRDSSIEPLKKQMHEAEVEVDAIECKIQSADLKTTYSEEYNAMRAEQEQHRQHALKAKASIDDQVEAMRAESENEIYDDDLRSGACSEDVESDPMKTSQRTHGGDIHVKPILIVAVAALVTAFAGLVGAQSTTQSTPPAVHEDQASQTKQNQKVSKPKPSATKASKAQNKKSSFSQDAAYAAAYKAGIPHSNTPASPK
jgi:hypothetical protein